MHQSVTDGEVVLYTQHARIIIIQFTVSRGWIDVFIRAPSIFAILKFI